MRYVIALGLSAVASFAVSTVQADTLRKESFEGCTESGYSLQSGSFGGDANDGIQCGNQAGANAFSFSFGSTVTGQDGSDYIGLEDLVGFGITNPNAVVLSDIDISGASNLGINFLFAAPSPTSGRYEASDYLELQYQVDGGEWVTVGRFFGADAGNVGMLHDANLDGSELTSVTNNMQRFTYSLNDRAEQGTVSGTTLTVRVRFNSDSAQEEMAFDDIVVTGDLPPPTMSFSSGTYSVDEDGTPSGAEVVIERRGSPAGETSIDVTFTSGSALGGDVDFNSTTLTVAFADGEISKTVALPIIDDELEEGDETFTISLTTNGSNAVLGATTSAVVTILDNDAVSIDAGTSDASSEPTDASTGEVTSDVSTTDNISSAVSSEDLSTDDVTTNDTSTSAPEESTSDARTTDTSSSDSTSSSDVAPIVDAGADVGDAGTPASSDSCDCRVGARNSSSTGWFGLALTGLVLARLNRRRVNAGSKALS